MKLIHLKLDSGPNKTAGERPEHIQKLCTCPKELGFMQPEHFCYLNNDGREEQHTSVYGKGPNIYLRNRRTYRKTSLKITYKNTTDCSLNFITHRHS
jgi:hypothetical protein